jgi:lipopolysaccharide biosynthesis glycosyltransferase
MATEFAVSRFLVPHLARGGLALFMDCDMLIRCDISELFDLVDKSKAVTVVKHKFDPPEGVKMDGQLQLRYARKNWSSVMVFNCDHEANKELTVDLVNKLPGRDLHRFCWLDDDEIGEVGPEWNWLAGHSDPAIDPKIVHFTDGIPTMPGYEDCAYADEWREELMIDILCAVKSS